MKRFAQVTLITSGVCGILGALFLLSGVLLGAGKGDFFRLFRNGFFSTEWNREEAVQDADFASNETTYQASEIEKLDFELSVGKLYIKENTENPDEIHVMTEGNLADITVKQTGNCLEITEKTQDILHKNKSKTKITVYLPKDKVYQEIDAELAVGSIVSELENLSADEVSLSNDTGKIEMEGICVTGDLDVDCSVGSVQVRRAEVAGDIEVDCGVGEVELSINGQKEDFNYTLNCGVGEIRVGESTYSGLSNSTKLDYHSSRSATVECGVGSVKLYFSDVENF